jgi:hypothetical protein
MFNPFTVTLPETSVTISLSAPPPSLHDIGSVTTVSVARGIPCIAMTLIDGTEITLAGDVDSWAATKSATGEDLDVDDLAELIGRSDTSMDVERELDYLWHTITEASQQVADAALTSVTAQLTAMLK